MTSCQTARRPSRASASTVRPSASFSAGGSGLRMRPTETADTRNVSASTPAATGPPNAWTMAPPAAGDPTSATDSLAESLALPASTSSAPTRSWQVGAIGKLEAERKEPGAERDNVKLFDAQGAERRS